MRRCGSLRIGICEFFLRRWRCVLFSSVLRALGVTHFVDRVGPSAWQLHDILLLTGVYRRNRRRLRSDPSQVYQVGEPLPNSWRKFEPSTITICRSLDIFNVGWQFFRKTPKFLQIDYIPYHFHAAPLLIKLDLYNYRNSTGLFSIINNL